MLDGPFNFFSRFTFIYHYSFIISLLHTCCQPCGLSGIKHRMRMQTTYLFMGENR